MAKFYAITPTRAEAAYIRYRLALAGESGKHIAKLLGCQPPLVSAVLGGGKHSAKVEAAIAQACGFADWNSMLRYIRGAGPAAQMLPAA